MTTPVPRTMLGRYLVIAILTFLACKFSQAQPSSREINRVIARQAHQLLLKSLPNSDIKSNDGPSLQQLEEFLNTQLFQTELLKNNWFEQQIKKLKTQTGIKLSARYQHNEYSAFYENFENDSRIRAGLEWELLENGLAEKKSELKRYEKDKEIHQLESVKSSRERNYAFLYNCMIYNFNQEKIKLLNKRVSFLEEHIRLLYELYFAHELAYTDIITQKSRLNEARIMLIAAQEFNYAFEKEIGIENIAYLNVASLPIVQINIERLLDPGNLEAHQNKLKKLKHERIDLSFQKRTDARLKVYSQYNYGSYRVPDNERSFVSFGISMQAPIQFDRGTTAELKTYEKAMIDDLDSEVWYNRVKEIMIMYEEYQYKMKQYSNFLHKTFHYDEKLRVEQVLLDSRMDVHTPMKALRHLDNEQAVAFELLHLKQQLYLMLLKIHLLSFQKEFLHCLKTENFNGAGKKLIGDRLAILNLSLKQQMNPEFIIKYLQKNEIYQVLLKGRGNSLRQWAEILNSEGFSIYYPREAKDYTVATGINQFQGTFTRSQHSGQYLLNKKSEAGIQQYLTTIPDQIFKNRNELEQWIKIENKNSGTHLFLFEDIERVMELDKKNLGVE